MLIGERTGETYGLGDRLRLKLVEADTATGGLLFDIVEVIERVERHAAAARPAGPRCERRGAAASGRASRGVSGQTVATTPLEPSAHLVGHDIGTPAPVDFWTAMRRGWRGRCPRCGDGSLFGELPEDAQPLPGLRAGARTLPRRRRAGVLHDFRSRPYRCAAGPGARALRRPAAAVVSCRVVAAAVGRACADPAAAHKRRGHRAPVGASDSRAQAFDRRSATSHPDNVAARRRLVLLLSSCWVWRCR